MPREQYERSMRHGPITGPVNGVLATACAAALVRVLDLPGWLPAAFALIGVAATIASGRRRGQPLVGVVYRTLAWLTAGTWATVTAYAGWSTVGVLILLGAGLAFGLFAVDFGTPVPTEADRTFGRSALHVQWETWINRVYGVREGNPGVTVTNIEDWPAGVGYTVRGRFPAGQGWTVKALQDSEGRLASMARNPKGCPVRIFAGEFQDEFEIQVTRVNALGELLPFPVELAPHSVTEDFQVGRFADRKPTVINLREHSMMVNGVTGGGKTNFLHVVTGKLASCTDALIWHIDLNGGGMSVPWMRPFVEEGIDPTLDWVARDPDETLRMALAADRIAKDRKARYAGLMLAHETDVLPTGDGRTICDVCNQAHPPAIEILVDETAEVMGENAEASRKVSEALRRLQRIGRAMGVRAHFATLRVTGDHAPIAVRKNVKVRVNFPVEEDAELAHFFEWKKNLTSDDLTHPGCAFIRTPDYREPVVFKAYRLVPSVIAQIARVTAHLRPQLDQAGQKVAGEDYRTRWERTRPYLLAMTTADGELEIDEAPATQVTKSDEPITFGAAAGKLAALVDDVQGALAEEREIAELEMLAALPAFDPRTPQPERSPVDDAKDTIVGVLFNAGGGMTFKELKQVLVELGWNKTDATIYNYLKALVEDRRVRNPRQGWWELGDF